MTVDLVNPGQGDVSSSGPSGPVADVVVLYGGWGGRQDGGAPLPAGPQTGTSQLVGRIQRMRLPPLHSVRILSLQGTLVDYEPIRQGLAFIQRNFHPSARIIIYGYSAGGMNAMDLARLIQVHSTYYGFSSGRFYPWIVELPRLRQQMSAETLGAVRVDLLITVDAASGPATALVSRSVPQCVRRNLNFYQTTFSPVGSHGGPNQAVDSSATVVQNIDLTGEVGHDAMDERTSGRVLDAIQGVLGREALPSLMQGDAAMARADRPLSSRSPRENTGPGSGAGLSPSTRRGIG